MFRRFLFSTTVATAGVFAAASWADVTPDQVWQDIEAQLKDAGYLVAATLTSSSGTLTASGLQIAQILPDSDIQVKFDIGSMTMTPNDAGEVIVTLPPSFPIDVRRDVGMDEDFQVTLNHRSTDLEIVAKQATSGVVYSYGADMIAVEMADFSADGFDPETDRVNAVMRMRDVTATALAEQTVPPSNDLQLNIGLIEVEASANSGTEDSFDLVTGISDVTYAAQIQVPEGASFDDLYPALQDGLSVTSAYDAQASHAKIFIKDGSETTTIDLITGPISATNAISRTAAQIQGDANDLRFEMTSADLPFPVSGTIANTSYGFDMPLAANAASQSFNIVMGLTGFGMSESIWSMFDPTAHFERSPFDLVLKLSGTGVLGVDLLSDALQSREPVYGQDGQIESLQLREFRLSGLGAEVTADGAFSFDNSDLVTFDGAPRPTGEATLVVRGLNQLMDGLTNAGLIASDDIFMARMMLGAFMTPSGEDELTSDFEITPDGKVFSNGQRLR